MAEHADDEAGAAGEGQAAGESADGERVAKVLARAGVASRREVERLIAAGRVTLNGARLTTPAMKVGANDVVTLDGKPVAAAEPTRIFRYHKPPGLVTTHRDPQGRPTVFEALPKGLGRLISVGRLDLSSEGLLLLTNDGELARRLELPSSGLKRRYRARARGAVDPARLAALKEGITVAGVHYGPIEARLEPGHDGEGANHWIVLSLAEGKNREVRRVLETLGLTVNRLIRISYGPYELGDLPRGEVRELTSPGKGGVGDAGRPPKKAGWAKTGARRKPAAGKSGELSSPSRGAGGGGGKPPKKAGWAKAGARPNPRKASGALPAGEEAARKGPKKPGWAKAGGKPRPAARTLGGSPPPPTPPLKGEGLTPPGSAPAGPRPARPRGPKPSASPSGSARARPPGPRKGGGPKRRG
jgi:23S rRNA pseudouridine2605 synthase